MQHLETDLSDPKPPRDKGWILAIGALLTLLVVLISWPRDRFDPVETSVILLSQSLAHDGDRLFSAEDDQRLSEWRLVAGEESVPYPQLAADGSGRFGGSVAFGLLLLPFVVMLGPAGAYLGAALWIGLAVVLVGRYLHRRLYADTVPLIAGMFLLSALAPASFHLWPEVLLAASAIILLAMLYTGQSRPGFAPDLYPEGPGFSTWKRSLRWAGIGLFSGILVSAEPALVGLLLPVVVGARQEGIGRKGQVVGVVAFGASLWLLAGGTPDALAALVPTFSLPDRHLLGWNTVYLIAGRHIGLLPYFAPLLLLPFCAREPARRSLWFGAALALVLLLWWRPFTFSGAPWSVGSRSFFPVYVALWFAVDRPPKRWMWLPVGLLAAAFLWPSWLHLRQPVADSQGRPLRAASYSAPWLPWETSQVGLAAESEIRTNGIQIRMLDARAWRGADGGLRVMGGVWADLLLVSPQPVSGLRFEVAEEGGATIELRGGELRQSVYRPDGSVGFLVGLEGIQRSHGVPGATGDQYFQSLALRLPSAPSRPIVVDLGGIEVAPIEESENE